MIEKKKKSKTERKRETPEHVLHVLNIEKKKILLLRFTRTDFFDCFQPLQIQVA